MTLVFSRFKPMWTSYSYGEVYLNIVQISLRKSETPSRGFLFNLKKKCLGIFYLVLQVPIFRNFSGILIHELNYFCAKDQGFEFTLILNLRNKR